MKKHHKKSESLVMSQNKSINCVTAKEDFNFNLKQLFQLPDLFLLISDLAKNFLENRHFLQIIRGKIQKFQLFYQDGSYELFQQIENLLNQNMKTLVFSTAFLYLLRSQNKESLLHKEISLLLREEDFEYKLRLLILKIRLYEEKTLCVLWALTSLDLKDAIMNQNLNEVLLLLKERYLQTNKTFLLEILMKGLKISFKTEISDILYRNPQNKVFIDKIASYLQGNKEKLVIDIIKDLKYDSHSEFLVFEQLITLAKRMEINEFSLRLLSLMKDADKKPESVFHNDLSFCLKTYDFINYEDFLERLLEAMNQSLSQTSHDFQEKVHSLVLDLQSSGTLFISLESDVCANVRESFDSVSFESMTQTKSLFFLLYYYKILR